MEKKTKKIRRGSRRSGLDIILVKVHWQPAISDAYDAFIGAHEMFYAITNVPHGRAGHPGEPVTFAKTTLKL
jgi:hypothetical protein